MRKISPEKNNKVLRAFPKHFLRGAGETPNLPKRVRVFVGMSGGVDSSVSAYLLNKKGYEVTGVFIRSYNLDGCADRDAEDARRVAEKLGIPFYVFDLEKEYKEKVVDYMVESYRAGLTPNPDVMCNKEIKFGLFLERALRLGADFVATGHYAVVKHGKTARLFAGKDKTKDQSYFLWALSEKQLRHSLFPVGNLLKSEVRAIARKARLPVADKKDSQGVCFMGQISLEDFLKKYIPEKAGEVRDEEGRILGKHRGAHFYTIGQRHGLGIAASEPVYVAQKDIKSNTVKMVRGADNPLLYRSSVCLSSVNWVSGKTPPAESSVFARVRYRQPLGSATLSPLAEKAENPGFELNFKEPVKFVASGQSAVIYSGDGEVLGGGIIT